MALKLPDLGPFDEIVTEKRVASPRFRLWWGSVKSAILAQESAQDETINRIRRMLSHTNPTTVITAQDDGANCTVTIADHVRVYADGTTLGITGGSFPGKTSDVAYAVYYDDPTLAVTAPEFEFTTTIGDAQAAVADGRHFLGVIYTPAAGSGLSQAGGGAYPAGSASGGET
jgi:hypothetical protein